MKHFPNIFHRCVEEGFDPRKEPIPVVPAQHYFMGGIKVDLGSRTSMKGCMPAVRQAVMVCTAKTVLQATHFLNLWSLQDALQMISYLEEKPDPCRPGSIDLKPYEDRDAVLTVYHEMVLNEIERMKKSHE